MCVVVLPLQTYVYCYYQLQWTRWTYASCSWPTGTHWTTPYCELTPLIRHIFKLPPSPDWQENKVDLALWAHHHSWQRFCRIYEDKCDDDNGIYHAVIGMGGKELSDEIPWVRESPFNLCIEQLLQCWYCLFRDEEDMPEWVEYLDYTVNTCT